MAEVKNTLSSTIDNINHFDIPKASGVYKIVNIVNNKIYYGETVNLRTRFMSHKKRLISNSHINSHLQNSVNKYGIDNFKYFIVEFTDRDNLKISRITLGNRIRDTRKEFNAYYYIN